MRKSEKPNESGLKTIDSPLYSYLEALYLSFYSQPLYVDVSKRWRGFGFLYLLLVVAILCIPLTIQAIQAFNKYFEDELIYPLKNIPTLYIRNGEVSMDYLEPYFVKNKKGQPVVMIDTTIKNDEFPEEYPSLNLLITKNKVMIRTPDPFATMDYKNMRDNVYIQNIDENTNEVFSGKKWVESAGLFKLKYISMSLIYPTMVAGFFVRLAIFLLILGLLGQLFAKVFHHIKLTYRESCRLLAVSATPLFLIVILTYFTGINFYFLSIVFLAILAGYYFYAVLAVKRDRGKVVLS